MELLFYLLIHSYAGVAFSCVPPVVSTDYNFAHNVTQISGSLGSDIRVACRAEPDGDVTSYVWQKNGENIQEPSIFSSFLIIRDLSVEDGGLYRCVVTTANCGTRYPPEISINTPPDGAVITGPSSVAEGHAFQLACSANGWPPPTYTWMFNGGGGAIAVSSVYRVLSASLTDSGEYTCVAQNSRGQRQDTVILTVFAVTAQVMSTASSPASLQASELMSSETSQPTESMSREAPQPTVTMSSSVASSRPSVRAMMSTVSQPTRATTTVSTVIPIPTVQPSKEGANTTMTGSESDLPTAPFIVLLALSVAMIVALVGVSIIIFVLVVHMMTSRKGDRKQLLGEEREGGGDEDIEMTDGIIRERDPERLSVHVPEKQPTSYVNIAFGHEEEDDDEEEEEEKGERRRYLDLRNGTGGTTVKVSPQRYHQQSDSSSKKQSPASAQLPHSVSMDVPNKRDKTSGQIATRVPQSREPGQLKTVHHLTPPVDRHKVGRPKGSKTRKKLCDTDTDKVQLLAAMEESLEQTQNMSDATVCTTLKDAQEDRVEKTVLGKVEGDVGKKRERVDSEGEDEGEKGEGESRQRGKEKERADSEGEDEGEKAKENVKAEETMETAADILFNEYLEGDETEKTERAVIVHENIGEASITFEEEGNTGDLLDEGSGAMLSSVLLSSGEEEGGGGGGGGEDGMVGEGGWDTATVGEGGSGEVREGELVGEGGGEEGGMVGEGGGREGEGGHQVKTDTSEKDGSRDGVLDGAGMKSDRDPDIHRMSVFVEKARKMGRSVSLIAQLDRCHPLSVADIQELVEEAVTKGNASTLSIEYKSLPRNSIQTLPLTPEEKHKNRYRNVLPNPHSAVLLSDTGVAGSQYINANYIRGYGDKERGYIATQGPTSHTVPDFWRMVWEEGVSIVVMTTPLAERGIQKCVKYWPSADDVDTSIYGNLVVRNNYEEVTEFYTISYLTVYPQPNDGQEVGEERDVYHFWYTAWSDFSVPKETASILKLREAVDAFRVPTFGPVLVHCSAGLGRSGTFMAIDMGIQQYKEEGTVDPLKYMCEMRQDRGGIIQTPAQYIYIHRALRDYVTA